MKRILRLMAAVLTVGLFASASPVMAIELDNPEIEPKLGKCQMTCFAAAGLCSSTVGTEHCAAVLHGCMDGCAL